MPTAIDFAFVFLFVVAASLIEHYIFWPRLRASIESGDANARSRGYRRVIVGQWLFAAVVFAIWTSHARSNEALRLLIPSGWRIGLAVGLVAFMIALTVIQLRSILRVPVERYAAIREKFGSVVAILPHDRREYIGFLLLSATAGFCEELLYRGYLAWFLSHWLGAPLGMFVSVLAFGVGHSYQGIRGAIKATLAGAVMAAVVLATGSLIPAMILHALVDAGSGTVAWLILRKPAQSPEAPSVSAAPAA